MKKNDLEDQFDYMSKLVDIDPRTLKSRSKDPNVFLSTVQLVMHFYFPIVLKSENNLCHLERWITGYSIDVSHMQTHR